MNNSQCPYTKISEAEASKIAIAYTWDTSNFQLVQTAHAQGTTVAPNSVTLGDQLTVPFFIFLASFFLFVILMSVVYIYHWSKFNLGDRFIEKFIPIYFTGLIILTIPLLYNLFF